MLTYKEIINAFTIKLDKAFFDVDIFTDDTQSDFEKSCFYVQLLPLKQTILTKELNQKGFVVSIKYYQEASKSKIDLFDIDSNLQVEFARTIEIKDRTLTIGNIESEILKDDIGYYLDFLITVNYADDVYIEKENFDNMTDVDISFSTS